MTVSKALAGAMFCMLVSQVAMAGPDNAERAAAPNYGKLDSEQLQSIRMSGREVLAAEQGQSPNPEASALERELKSLSKTLDKVLMPRPSSIALQGSSPVSQAAQPDEETELQAHLADLEASHGKMLDDARQSGDEERIGRAQALSEKDAEISQALRDALDKPGGERWKALAELRNRLQPKTYQDLLLERNQGHEIEPTPTLTTMAHHRPVVEADPNNLPPATGYSHGEK